MQKQKKVSLKDIARKTGTSTALVSYVLNNKFTNRINAETSRKIKQLAEELNYYPNQVAKSLKNNKTLMLGLIVADISNLFFSSIARVIEDEAKEHHYNVLFSSADENLEKFDELIQVFMSRQVDGIILACPEGAEKKLRYLKEQRMPFVVIDRHFPFPEEMNSVTINNYKASRDIVEHLHERGYKKPVMITLASNLYHLQEREKGFRDAAGDLLNMTAPKVIRVPEDKLTGRMEPAILELLDSKAGVDALCFATNKISIEGLAVLAKHQIAVPERVGVVCFDEVNTYRMFYKSVTYVKQPLDEIGGKAVELILSRINGSLQPKKIVLDTKLVIGQTSDYKSK